VPDESAEFRRCQEGVSSAEVDLASRSLAAVADLAPAPGDVRLRDGGAEAGCTFCAELMSQHLANAPLQVAACRALAGLLPALPPEAPEGRMSVELLAAAMRRHASCPDVLEAACSTLGGCMAGRQDLQAVASTNAAAEEVVGAMRRFQNSVELQTWASGALAGLSANHPGNQASVAACRGIDAVLTAVRRHPDSALLQTMACGAIGNLSANNLNNQAAIAAGGGIDLVLTAMQRHEDAATVQQSAIGAVWCLVKKSPENQQLVSRSGGTELMVDAVQRHHYDPALRAMASGALQVLVPGLGDAMATVLNSVRQPPAAAWETPPRTPNLPVATPEPKAAPAPTVKLAEAHAPAPVSAPIATLPAKPLPAASTSTATVPPVSARGLPPRSAAWALETETDEDDEPGGGAAMPPGMTARGPRPAGSLVARPPAVTFAGSAVKPGGASAGQHSARLAAVALE